VQVGGVELRKRRRGSGSQRTIRRVQRKADSAHLSEDGSLHDDSTGGVDSTLSSDRSSSLSGVEKLVSEEEKMDALSIANSQGRYLQ